MILFYRALLDLFIYCDWSIAFLLRREDRGILRWILSRLVLLLLRCREVQVSPPGLTPVPPSSRVDVQMYHRPAVGI